MLPGIRQFEDTTVVNLLRCIDKHQIRSICFKRENIVYEYEHRDNPRSSNCASNHRGLLPCNTDDTGSDSYINQCIRSNQT